MLWSSLSLCWLKLVMGCGSSSASGAPPSCVEFSSEAEVHQEFTFSATKLGAGAFGAVVSARDARTQQPVAMKQIRKSGLADQQLSLADVYREVEIAVAMSACAHVVRHLRCFETDEHVYLAMEPVTRGDLSALIEKVPYHMVGHAETWWGEGVAARLFGQLLAALAHFQASGVLHADVKPSNILLTEEPPRRPNAPAPSQAMLLKLCDFGFAHRVGAGAKRFRESDGKPRVFGTPEYTAPEMLAGRAVGVAADAWSAGVILYYLLCGERPCDVRPATMQRDLATLMKGDFATDGEAAADTWAHVSADAKALVGALTQVAVARRLSPTAALKHAWAKVATPGPPAPPPSDQETPNAAATNGNESEALRI